MSGITPDARRRSSDVHCILTKTGHGGRWSHKSWQQTSCRSKVQPRIWELCACIAAKSVETMSDFACLWPGHPMAWNQWGGVSCAQPVPSEVDGKRELSEVGGLRRLQAGQARTTCSALCSFGASTYQVLHQMAAAARDVQIHSVFLMGRLYFPDIQTAWTLPGVSSESLCMCTCTQREDCHRIQGVHRTFFTQYQQHRKMLRRWSAVSANFSCFYFRSR